MSDDIDLARSVLRVELAALHSGRVYPLTEAIEALALALIDSRVPVTRVNHGIVTGTYDADGNLHPWPPAPAEASAVRLRKELERITINLQAAADKDMALGGAATELVDDVNGACVELRALTAALQPEPVPTSAKIAQVGEADAGAQPVSARDHQQRRGAAWDIIDEALTDYDGFMLDDDFEPMPTLRRIMDRMRERRNLYSPEADAGAQGAPKGEG